ncbi:MAG: class I SAM-dependent methyltransferase [Deltaproteobacteria bacterium]
MRIINNNKLDLSKLRDSIARPALYTKSTHRFWDDDHISAQMLALHLDPEVEAASRTHETIDAEAAFIIKETGMDGSTTVLDLGCGPGLYVKRFAQTGARVTGIDMSARSLNYAEATIKSGYDYVNFLNMNYLELDMDNTFDVVTLIYYDFCVLKPDEQRLLLKAVHKALKRDGVFILDVITANRSIEENTAVSIYEGGFWSPKPHMEICNTFVCSDPLVETVQYTIIDEEGEIRVTRFYNHHFSLEQLAKLFAECGFVIDGIFNNLQGDTFTADSDTLGILARRS